MPNPSPSPSRDPSLREPDCRSTNTLERIGVFDSGIGGLSVLHALRSRLPAASFVYVGDSAHAPYGNQSAAAVTGRCERIVEYLVSTGVGLVVVACNTASLLAIARLRDRWPEMRFVGVEPGIKPAVAASRAGRIAVLATPATVHSARMKQLVEQHAAHVFVHLQPCPGLVESIEGGNSASLKKAIEFACAPVRHAVVDTVALGCTHFPLVARQIAYALGPKVRLIDTGAAIAERVASLWLPQGTDAEASTLWFNTGTCDGMRRFLRASNWRGGTEISRLHL